MKKLPAVEDARAVMTEGTQWGVWKWLMEKKRVRAIADQARAALDDVEMKVKLTWSDDLKIAYNQLVAEDGETKRTRRKTKNHKPAGANSADAKALAAVKHINEADDDAYNAHEDAEDLFAEAERKMSTSMAREAARKALAAYDLHEAAIRKAEALAREK
ncbi:MAG: hypothetical protein ABSD98_10400 [Candidatus Korobacteraceae bacterium]|jgi:hypothetical protein